MGEWFDELGCYAKDFAKKRSSGAACEERARTQLRLRLQQLGVFLGFPLLLCGRAQRNAA